MTSETLPGDLEDLDFEIEKEEWNTYELKDGVKIKGRIIILRIAKPRNSPPGQYGVQNQNIFVTYAPNSLKGVPSTPPPMDQIDRSSMYPVEVTHSNEIWNVYHILRTGDRIKVKLVANEVFRVKDIFDRSSNPYYIVTSGVMISPVSKGVSL
jgi:hypothetical protein